MHDHYHPPVKRSVTINGHQTSISLEPLFWGMLKAAALERGQAVNALVAHIDAQRIRSDTPPGLASAIRIWLAQKDDVMARPHLRWATDSDYTALGQIMYDAVHALPSPYSEAQRRAWMPEPRQGEQWDARLDRQHIVIAEIDGQAAGFMSLQPQDDASEGYVDFAYILPAYRGSGLFAALYGWVEARALGAGMTRLTTHASLAARPAFERMGFAITAEEIVAIGAEELRRYAMAKAV